MQQVKGILFMVMLGLVTVATAQYDGKARKILDAMSSKYKTIPSFTANITYSLDNTEDDVHESFEGKIGIKGKKFRMLAEDQEIIINGNTVWTYLSDGNEVNIDTYSPDDDDVTPSNIYNIYENGYKYILFGEEKIGGKEFDVVDLSPEKIDSDYFRIRLTISKTDHILKKFTMYAKSGNRYTYDISNFDSKANLPDSYFVFDTSKYNGVEVIDLRIDN